MEGAIAIKCQRKARLHKITAISAAATMDLMFQSKQQSVVCCRDVEISHLKGMVCKEPK